MWQKLDWKKRKRDWVNPTWPKYLHMYTLESFISNKLQMYVYTEKDQSGFKLVYGFNEFPVTLGVYEMKVMVKSVDLDLPDVICPNRFCPIYCRHRKWFRKSRRQILQIECRESRNDNRTIFKEIKYERAQKYLKLSLLLSKSAYCKYVNLLYFIQ